MVAYYPEEFNISRICKTFPQLEMVNDDEEERLVDVAERRRRGKGAPKKAKSKGWSSCFFFSQVQFLLIDFFF